MNLITGILTESLMLFMAMAPYMLLGMAMAGLLAVFLRASFVSKHIGKHSFGSVVKAAVFGVPLPLCSCGVVPTAVFLQEAGASKSAVVSFLLSTPQTGVDSIIATYGLLGPVMAIFRPVSALLLGIFGGLLGMVSHLIPPRKSHKDSQQLQKEHEHQAQENDGCGCGNSCHETSEPAEHGCSCGCNSDQHSTVTGMSYNQSGAELYTSAPNSLKQKTASILKKIWQDGFIDFMLDTAGSFLFGILLGGTISYMIPDNYFAGTLLGSGLLSMLFITAVSVPLYVCSTSSIPIAAALMIAGLSPGAAYVFLTAGPATNAATISVLRKKFGSRMTLVYLFAIITGSILLGSGLDLIIDKLPWSVYQLNMEKLTQLSEEGTGPFTVVFSLFLGVLLVWALGKNVSAKFTKRGEHREHSEISCTSSHAGCNCSK